MVKKFLIFLITLSFTFLFCTTPINARAGGGGSGGSNGGSGGRAGGYHSPHHFHHPTHKGSMQSVLITIFGYAFVWYAIIIIKKRHIIKAKIKTKYYMKENGIDYKCIKKRIADTYFTVQEAWANNDMSPAANCMTSELIEKFKIKLTWMNFAHKKNVMKKIRLLAGSPIYLDHTNKDKMWVYIKGKMIDYIINNHTNEVISGSNISESFVEFWLFIKNENNEWVLSEILQENEFNKISI